MKKKKATEEVVEREPSEMTVDLKFSPLRDCHPSYKNWLIADIDHSKWLPKCNGVRLHLRPAVAWALLSALEHVIRFAGHRIEFEPEAIKMDFGTWSIDSEVLEPLPEDDRDCKRYRKNGFTKISVRTHKVHNATPEDRALLSVRMTLQVHTVHGWVEGFFDLDHDSLLRLIAIIESMTASSQVLQNFVFG